MKTHRRIQPVRLGEDGSGEGTAAPTRVGLSHQKTLLQVILKVHCFQAMAMGEGKTGQSAYRGTSDLDDLGGTAWP